MAAGARPAPSSSGFEDLVLWGLGGVGVLGATVWAGAQLAVFIASHRTFPAGLASALAEAVKLGIVNHTDGWLVYASRAEGWHMEQLASRVGRSGSWAWRRRVRAEQLLEGAGAALAAAG